MVLNLSALSSLQSFPRKKREWLCAALDATAGKKSYKHAVTILPCQAQALVLGEAIPWYWKGEKDSPLLSPQLL